MLRNEKNIWNKNSGNQKKGMKLFQYGRITSILRKLGTYLTHDLKKVIITKETVQLCLICGCFVQVTAGQMRGAPEALTRLRARTFQLTTVTNQLFAGECADRGWRGTSGAPHI